MKQLFDYQKEAISKVNQSFAKGHQSTLLISLMGTGKTVMAAALAHQYLHAAKRVLFVVDLNCLLNQISAELWDWKIPYTVVQGDRKTDLTMPVVVASAQTIDARLQRKKVDLIEWLGRFDLIILDEAHNLAYRQVLKELRKVYQPKGCQELGMTATPWRTNPEEYLGQHYTDCVVGMQPPELIKIGRAVPCRIYHFDDYFDLSTIAKGRDGDYLDADMEKQAISTAQLQKVFTEWQFRCPGETTIAFCSTVKHAQILAAYFNEQGVNSACIHADTTEEERLQLFARLKTGELKLITSINTLTAGFDCPRASCVLYVRLTESKSAYFQAAGRAARCYPGKEFYTILDFGNNCKRHGSPMNYQDYSIHKKGHGGREKHKACPECKSWISVFAKICPDCGFEFKRPEDKEDESPDFSETDFDMPMVEFFVGEDVERLRFFREERKRCYLERSHPDTANQTFKKRYGFLPPFDWAYQAIFGAAATKEDVAAFLEYIRPFAPHDFWIKMECKREFGEAKTDRQQSKKKKKWEREEVPRSHHVFTRTVQWYNVLGITQFSTKEQAKAAYRELSRKWHPDVCRSPDTETKMKEINWAWEEAKRRAA